MTGALLSEVWPDMVQKPKKTKRLKKKKSGDPLMDPPLEPDEMETELLDDRINEELDPRKRLSGMRVSPYTDNETHELLYNRLESSYGKQSQQYR